MFHPPVSLRARLVVGLAAAFAFTVVGCHKSSSNNPVALNTAESLTVPLVKVEQFDASKPVPLQIAHPMQIRTTIVAGRPRQDVAIGYHLLNRLDVDQRRATVRQFNLGTKTYRSVDVGSHEYDATLVIPNEVNPPGDYYLICCVDPIDVHAQNNEQANYPDRDRFHGTLVTVADAQRNMPDLVLRRAVPDEKTVVLEEEPPASLVEPNLDPESEDNPALGVTVELDMTGANAIPGGVPLSTTVTVAVDGQKDPIEFPLNVWDTDKNDWVDHLTVELAPGSKHSVHLALNVPDSNAAANKSKFGVELSTYDAIEAAIRKADTHVFKVTVYADREDGIPEYEEASRPDGRGGSGDDDNKITADVVIVLPPKTLGRPKTDPIAWQKEWKKGWKNRFVGLQAAFAARFSIDNRGMQAGANGSVPVTLLGNTKDVLEVDVHGQHVNQDTARSSFGLDIKGLGRTLYTVSKEFGHNYTYDKKFPISTPDLTLNQFIGPVPVIVHAKATGEVGIHLEANISNGFNLLARPFIDIGGDVSGGIGIKKIVSVELDAEFRIIKDTFTAHAEGKVFGIVEGDDQFLGGNVGFKLENSVVGPTLNVGGKVTFIGPYFIGLKEYEKKFTLVRWKTFARDDVLLERTTKDMKIFFGKKK